MPRRRKTRKTAKQTTTTNSQSAERELAVSGRPGREEGHRDTGTQAQWGDAESGGG